MINTQTLKGNLVNQDYSTAFTLSQGDKGVPFRVELLENGTPYTLQSTDIVTIEWLKPNGNPFLQEGGIKYGTNYIEFTTPEAVAQYSGSGSFNIIISNSDVRKGTIRREYKVVPTSMKLGSVSEDTITDAITELRELSVEIADTVQNNQDLINNNQAATKQDIANVNSSLEEKASNVDLQTQAARIDSFTSLAEGSTTGDAELIDGRIGANGTIYNNIGGSIRGQYNILNEDIETRLGYPLRKEFNWHIGKSYDINTGLPNTNETLKCTDITSFNEMFTLLNTNVLLFKNVNQKMFFFLYDKNKKFLTTMNYEWIRIVTKKQLENKYFYFAIVSPIAEANGYITGEDTIKNDIDILKEDIKNKKKQFIMSHFEDEERNKVRLAISYDGIHFDRIGEVFTADETRDPCIIKHNDTYYLVYSHWANYATLNLPIYKSSDLMNWTLHSTIPIDLSSFGSGYNEIWAPEFFKDIDGTLYLSFASRIIADDKVNAFVGILHNNMTEIINIGKLQMPDINNTYDVSFYNDNRTYYAVCHSEKRGTFKDTYVYKSNNKSGVYGEYTKWSKLPTENYIEGLCIEKVGDTFYIYGDETVEENENPDHRQLVLFTSKDMLTFDRTVCGTNFRHAKIIKADDTDIARAERAMIVKKYLKQ